jgi:hypothetical protein
MNPAHDTVNPPGTVQITIFRESKAVKQFTIKNLQYDFEHWFEEIYGGGLMSVGLFLEERQIYEDAEVHRMWLSYQAAFNKYKNTNADSGSRETEGSSFW